MTGFTVFGARPPRGDVDRLLRDLQAFARARGGDVQVLDATSVFGREHLESAYEHAMRAQDRGTSVASSLAVEFLRYAAGERRIDRAIERIGAKTGRPVAVALFGDVFAAEVVRAFALVRDDRVLRSGGKSLRRLGITVEEERTLPALRARELVLEKVALADLAR